MSDKIDIMNMAHKAVAFDNTLTAMRRWLCDNRGYDIIHLPQLRDSAEKEWLVCDMHSSGAGVEYKATFHEGLIWALENPNKFHNKFRGDVDDE